MDRLQEARACLRKALAEYSAARSLSEVETAMLALHTGLETAFRAYLEGTGGLPPDKREDLRKQGAVNFPGLVDLMGDHTTVLGSDRRTRALLVSLNTTRNRIAHPLDKPSRQEIVNDAGRLAEMVVDLWPRLFRRGGAPDMTPVTLEMLRERERRDRQPRPESRGRRKGVRGWARKPALGPVPDVLRSLWRGEGKPRRGVWRFAVAAVVVVLTGAAWRAALSLARWPAPLGKGSFVLLAVAIGLAVWSGSLLWRAFRMVGARLVLILVLVGFVGTVGVRAATAEDGGPVGEAIVFHTQGVAGQIWRTVSGFAEAVVGAPAAFRFATTGRKPLAEVPGVPADATPVRGNIIEPVVTTELDQPTPTATSAADGATPEGPAEEEEPASGGYVEVSGTGGQTLRARSGPGIGYEVVARYREGTRLRVLEGPVAADGFAWLKVRGDEGEGWCADEWLTPVR
jgi:hypothetical protein